MSPARSGRSRAKSAPVRANAKARAKSNPVRAIRESETYAGMASAAVLAKTGKGWQEWFALLDGAKASTWPHKEIAAFLHDEHGVPGWWCQMVTVGYEQARGKRVQHQRADGKFAASASKTIDAPIERLFDAFRQESARDGWLGTSGITIRKSTRPKSMRITWKDGTSVSVSFIKKGPAKSQVAIEHEKLTRAGDVARMKRAWGTALDKLKTKLEGN
jgi:hypothetical protein